MRKSNHLLVVYVFFLCSLSCFADAFVDIDIWYIANEGFLIKTPSKSVLIDALFEERVRNLPPEVPTVEYPSPTPELLEEMISGQEPFEHIDLVLVTHGHYDHYAVTPAQKFLHAHAETKFLGGYNLAYNLSAFPSIISQLTGLSLDSGEVYGLFRNDIFVKACGTPHEFGHMAYIVDLGDVRILHCGDSYIPGGPESPGQVSLGTEGIDIVFLPWFQISQANANYINEVIQPQLVVLMHTKIGAVDELAQQATMFQPETIVFGNALDSKTIQLSSKPVYDDTPVKNVSNGQLYPSIQTAIDVAQPGDYIVINKGRYQENVIINKPLTLQSKQPENLSCIMQTVIEGQAGKPVVRLNGQPVVLKGLSIIGGQGVTSKYSMNLVNCMVLNNLDNAINCETAVPGDLNLNCELDSNDLILLSELWPFVSPDEPNDVRLTLIDPYSTGNPLGGSRR